MKKTILTITILSLLIGISLSGCIDTKEYLLVSFKNNRNEEIQIGFNIDYGKYNGSFYIDANSDDFLPTSEYKLVKGEKHVFTIWWGYGNNIKQNIQWVYNVTSDILFTVHENGSITYTLL